MRWPKYWSFSFSISPSKEHPRLISFRLDWLDLLAVQGTLKSFLQHHSSKASILGRSALFTVQLSHPYMTTAKTIALTRQTFVDKIMSLLFNVLYRLVITFFPRRKLGGIGGRRRGGRQRMRWLDGTTDLMDMSFCVIRELVMNRKAWRDAIHGVEKSWT